MEDIRSDTVDLRLSEIRKVLTLRIRKIEVDEIQVERA